MTKKIKIIISTVLLIITLITIALVALSLNTVSHCMDINAPDRIAVYYNNEYTNKVYSKSTEQYDAIYSSILNGCNQKILPAIASGSIFKDVKIKRHNATQSNFNQITINFIYDTPQVVKYKSKLYNNSGINYWYQNLVFHVTATNKYQYNTVAIIPPENDINYINYNSYCLHYEVYSNFAMSYRSASNLFD